MIRFNSLHISRLKWRHWLLLVLLCLITLTKLIPLWGFIFDLYLRGNHVAEGRKSYSGVVGLILAWESHHTKRPFDG